MRHTTARILGSALLAATIGQAQAGNVDAKLLDMLLKNGSITAAQHAELSADLKREERKEQREAKQYVKQKDYTAYTQLAGWAAKTKLTGDMRVRQDVIAIEDEANNGGRDQNRQRVRARIAAITAINPQVETGIQIATGSSADRRSTNQSMDAYFDKKSVWLDLGYISYKPIQVPGLQFVAGKMKQPWLIATPAGTSDMVWDPDINPEGFDVTYIRKNGTTTLFGSAGYYVIKDNVDGEGVKFNNDLSMYAAQIGAAFDVGSSVRLTLGANLNDFNDERQRKAPFPAVALRANGNTTDMFREFELFGQMDVIGLPFPLSLYSDYVTNTEARDFFDPQAKKQFNDGNEDTGWLVGFRTNIGGVALDYNYRDVERNAVIGSFTDSDFASGFTGSKGHKFKAQYDFLTNFNVTVSYFLTESDNASRFNNDGANVDTLMVDLNAKF